MESAHADASLVNAVMASDLTVKDLWLGYLGLGGRRTRQELQQYLAGDVRWPGSDRSILTQALNEHSLPPSDRSALDP